jgi:nicotinate-nucleotide adenylyltransferase
VSEPRRRRLGILGGTFNPPHVAHIALAKWALAQLELECVYLMPAHTSPHKLATQQDPGPEHRLRMCQLQSQGCEGVRVCAMEVRRGGVSYTVDTLRSIATAHPDVRLTLLLGADTACTLPSWREPDGLLKLTDLAVAQRTDSQAEDVLRCLALVDAKARVSFLQMPRIPVSSSQVRARIAAGEDIAQMVDARLADYIAARRLYTDSGGST